MEIGQGRERRRDGGGAAREGLARLAEATGDPDLREVIEREPVAGDRDIVGDLPDVMTSQGLVDDVLIDASAPAIDGPGGILGQASTREIRSGSFLPAYGVMRFDSADLVVLEASGQLLSVILHEMGHVIGIGTIWSLKGLLSGAGGSDPRFTGAGATAEYNAIFGTSAASVPVENTGGSGSRDSHWRESVFGNELMTGFLNLGTSPLSRVTVASLADLGYSVNLGAADFYIPPSSLTGLLSSAPAVSGGILSLELPITVLDGATPGAADQGIAGRGLGGLYERSLEQLAIGLLLPGQQDGSATGMDTAAASDNSAVIRKQRRPRNIST